MAVISGVAHSNNDVYAIKRAHFLGKPVTYICQNINGPCPLLAIANLLLLRGHIAVDSHLHNGVITASDLIQIVLKRLVDANPPLPERDQLGRLTQEKTLQDVKQLMPSLLVGLDVNVRFHSITDFEYTVACAVFDMLDIALVHGWLIDVQDEKTVDVVQNKSYNELIERLVDYRGVLMTEKSAAASGNGETQARATNETSETSCVDEIDVVNLHIETTSSSTPASPSHALKSPSKRTVDVLQRERLLSTEDATDTATTLLEEGPVLEEFFASSASQLTYYGLVKLHEDLRERQLAVFFRNNHFSTLFKIDGALYLLVTDAGYLDEPTVVWEQLNEIDGDTEYFNDQFRPLNASETRQQTILQQQEEARRRQQEGLPDENESAPVSENLTDEDRTTSQSEEVQASSEADPDYLLALKFQQEEEEQARQAAARAQAAAPISTEGTRVALRPLGAGAASHEPREASEGYDSRGQSQRPYSSSEGDAFAINANGELVLSEEELQAQQQAELYYRQQRQQQQQPPGTTYVAPGQQMHQPNRAATPSRSPARRDSTDCALM